MEREDIIRMAQEAGFPVFGTKVVANNPADQIIADAVTQHYQETAIQFAQLITAEVKEAMEEEYMNDIWQAIKIEREACAKVCDELVIEIVGNSAMAVDQCSRAIRARGQQ